MIHVYVISGVAFDEPLLPAGVEGAPVRAVAEGELTALVSEHGDVPGWGVCAAWAHEVVVEAAMAMGTVLPASLGTFLESEEEVRALLRGRHDEFADDLRRLAGYVEVGVRGAGTELPSRLRVAVSEWRPQRDALACLVAEHTLDSLLAAVAEMESVEGMHLVVTGPWPPYSFVTEQRGLTA